MPISWSYITCSMKFLSLKTPPQLARGGFEGAQRKGSACPRGFRGCPENGLSKENCGLALGWRWPDFAFSNPRVLTAPGTGTGECSSRFTGKCQVRRSSRAPPLPEWAPAPGAWGGRGGEGHVPLREVLSAHSRLCGEWFLKQAKGGSLQSAPCPGVGAGESGGPGNDQTLSLVSSWEAARSLIHSISPSTIC